MSEICAGEALERPAVGEREASFVERMCGWLLGADVGGFAVPVLYLHPGFLSFLAD